MEIIKRNYSVCKESGDLRSGRHWKVNICQLSFPDPVFIDTEGSTNSMDVARLPKAYQLADAAGADQICEESSGYLQDIGY